MLNFEVDDSRRAIVGLKDGNLSISIEDRGADALYHPVQSVSIPSGKVDDLIAGLQEVVE